MASGETARGAHDRPVRVFVSYSHRDASYLDSDNLFGFLRGLERDGVAFWTDRAIGAGDRWEEVILRELGRADIALALVSQAFLDSPYCQDVEIRALLERSVTVLPVILSPCDWQRHAWLAATQALPRDDRTLEEHFAEAGARKRLFHDLREALRRQVERVRADGAPERRWLGGDAPRLPAPPELFVGREAAVEAVIEHTRGRRLVTLLGPGGSGKTTLALQVAHVRAGDFRDGVWWVELDALEEPSLVPLTLARALGIREQARRPPTDILADHLADAELLLVLDNCEHLVDACSEVARELLASCPGVHLLATSRIALDLGDQQHVPVEPLDVPDENTAEAPDALLDVAGVRLFVETYLLSDPAFALDRANAAAIAKIVARLDGIPLAIRLAAAGCARSVSLTIPRVAEQLTDVLPLLGGGATADRNVLDRPHHVTLEATLDWSYALLDEPARRLLARLAVFVGGFSWDDVVDVCFDEPEAADDATLADLVRGSLVVPSSSSTLEVKRFRLLEVVRQYARAKLDALGERDARVRRHGEHAVALTESAAEHLLGDGQAEQIERLEVDLANLRVALTRAIDRRDADTALRLAAALWRFWEIRGYLAEGREKIDRVLRELPGTSRRHLTLYEGASVLAYRQGDLEEAERTIRRALELARGFDDPARIANALNDLGNITSQRGDFESALEAHEETYRMRREITPRNERQVAVALNNLGGTKLHLGRFAEAREHLDESRRIFESIENWWESGFPLARLGTVSLFEKRFDEAEAFYRTSFERRIPTDDKRGMGEATNGLARVAVWRGDVEAARRHLREALRLRREVGDQRGLAESLECLVFYLRAHGRFLDGVRVLTGAEAIRRPSGSVAKPLFQPFLEGFRRAAREHLGDAAYNAVAIEGELLGRDGVIDLAEELLAESDESP